MTGLPLRLTLEPLIPQRTPSDELGFRYGFKLRIPDGPLIGADDPLLAGLGAEVVPVLASALHDEELQSESVDPGRFLRACVEAPNEDDELAVGVWDEDGSCCAGFLPPATAQRVAALMSTGLEVQTLAVSERRAEIDDRRVALEVLVAMPGAVSIDHDASTRFSRPKMKARRRVVLFADEGGELRWWDAAAERGPADVEELPVSHEMRRELAGLRDAYATFATDPPELSEGHEVMEAYWQRAALAEHAVNLWQRTRRELGREFAVGYLGPGMEAPVWSPSELVPQVGDEDIPF